MKIVGFKKVTYKFDDGKSISGFEVYCNIEEKSVTGFSIEKFFISDQRAGESDFVPELGMDIDVYYNKYKKVSKVEVA